MWTPRNTARSMFIAGCLALGSMPLLTRAQSTALTYQGQLTSGGSPAQGLHDIRFRLFNAASGGAQFGTTQCLDNVSVKDGVFTATIDFGPQFNSTSDRWLEIEVRKDTGLSCGDTTGYTVLTPRQPITPTPRATSASVANALAAPDGSPAQAVFVDNTGNVGIGTTAPAVPLHIVSTSLVPAIHVASPFAVMNLQDTGADATQTGYISYRNKTGTETAWIGFGSAGDPDFSIVNARAGGDIVLNPFSGNVGIGTSTPAARLEVRGDIRLGATGQYFANSAEENLRTIRGTVNGNGTVAFGSGWSVSRTAAGSYTIFFNTPFSTRPSVVVSSSAATRTAAVGTPVEANFAVRLFNSAGTLTDDIFYFIATGPR